MNDNKNYVNRGTHYPIPNSVLRGDGVKQSMISKYGANEFAVFSYISCSFQWLGCVTTCVGFILSDLNWNGDADKDIVKRALINYMKEGYLRCSLSEEQILKATKTQMIKVQLTPMLKNGKGGSYTLFYGYDSFLYNYFGKSRNKIFALYCCLYSYKNEKTGIAFPSIDTLSENAGLAKQTVANYLEALCNFGVIDILQERDDVVYSRKKEKNMPIRRDVNKYRFRYGEKKVIFSQPLEQNIAEFKEAQEGWYRPRKPSKLYETEKERKEFGVELDYGEDYLPHSELIKNGTIIPF